MKNRNDYCKTLEACLEKLTEKITALETVLDEAKGRERVNRRNQIDGLKRIGEQMRAKMEEINRAEDHEWKTLRKGAEKIKKQLEDSLDFPISRFP